MNNQSENPSADTNNQNDILVTKSPSKKFTKGQIASFATLALLLIVLPITTSVALITTRLNSRAYLPATPPTPPTSCNNPIKNLKNLNPCNNNPNERFNGYMAVLITCQNNYTETYKFKTCTKSTDIQNIAKNICQKHAICPTPTTTNRPPQIITTKLNDVTVNRQYTTTIEARDPDIRDIIKITVTGLPAGLKLDERCNSLRATTNSNCKITGKVTKYAEPRKIQIKVTDSQGTSSTKTLNLVIRNK